jgi:hypothetical protein
MAGMPSVAVVVVILMVVPIVEVIVIVIGDIVVTSVLEAIGAGVVGGGKPVVVGLITVTVVVVLDGVETVVPPPQAASTRRINRSAPAGNHACLFNTVLSLIITFTQFIEKGVKGRPVYRWASPSECHLLNRVACRRFDALLPCHHFRDAIEASSTSLTKPGLWTPLLESLSIRS